MNLPSRRYLAKIRSLGRHDPCPVGLPKPQKTTNRDDCACLGVVFCYSGRMKQVVLSKQAEKALRKMPANTAQTIREKIAILAAGGAALANNVTKLVGSDFYRLRVGDWRVIFDDQGNILQILAVKPRGGAYK